ncbi:MAG: DNA-binding response regulator [Flavobacteriales bacterium]|nr:DNA-binding response regulator [Flavobacteriales bacterium]MBG16701.1 DNA-binding response regulator [Crocinitomicaceae bacterium]|tara:strand:- start:3015 stop:3776 length:762 start_codon:yes stop_codon:yes gene_type:complete
MPLRAIIVDDEFNARENLKLLIHEHCPELTIVGLAESAKQAKELISSKKPELVFLDISMPVEDGFSLLNSFKERNFSVVFTTAYNEYAFKAFKADAVDYLEKPICIDDLKKAVAKVIKYHSNNTVNNSTVDYNNLSENIQLSKQLDKISVPTKNGYLIIDNKDIVNLEASDNYTMIHLIDGSRHLSSKNIKVYEENLDNTIFFRSHKSHIINVEYHLREFSRSEGNVAIMTNGKYIPISRRKMPFFMNRINCF